MATLTNQIADLFHPVSPAGEPLSSLHLFQLVYVFISSSSHSRHCSVRYARGITQNPARSTSLSSSAVPEIDAIPKARCPSYLACTSKTRSAFRSCKELLNLRNSPAQSPESITSGLIARRAIQVEQLTSFLISPASTWSATPTSTVQHSRRSSSAMTDETSQH
jgi:hypothetical protein